MEEIWKDIYGYEGLYKISNTGKIKSMAKTWVVGHGIKRSKPETFLSIHVPNVSASKKEQYPCINMTKGDGSGQKTKSVHVLLATHFIPNPENKECVNHINGNKNDFSLSNLEWATRSEDRKHAYRTGLKISKKGGDSVLAKPIMVIFKRQIKTVSFRCAADACREIGISKTTIYNNLSGRTKSVLYEFQYIQ